VAVRLLHEPPSLAACEPTRRCVKNSRSGWIWQLLLLFLSLLVVTLTVICKRRKTRAVDFIWVFSPFWIFSWSSPFSDLFHFCSRIFSVHLISAGGRTSSCGRIVGGRTCGCSRAWGTALWCAAGGWPVAQMWTALMANGVDGADDSVGVLLDGLHSCRW